MTDDIDCADGAPRGRCPAALALLVVVLAALLPLGCQVSASHRCNTTSDCIAGVCVNRLCRSPVAVGNDSGAPETLGQDGAMETADSGAPETLGQDGAMETADARDGAEAPHTPGDGPDTAADTGAPDSDTSDNGPDTALDAGEPDVPASGTDASTDESGPDEPMTACPAWADWPMPSPPSLTDNPSDPLRSLPNAQSYDTSNPDVVLDLVTQLVWQSAVSPDALTWSEAESYCADLDVGGRDDWRLPSRIELISLVDWTQIGDVAAGVFKEAPTETLWTCTPGPGNPLFAWYVSFSDGGVPFTQEKLSRSRVRCTAGLRTATPPPRRYDSGVPGEVRDLKTNLVWRAAPAADLIWGDAYQYCQGLGTGWRLPSVTELQTLINEALADQAVDATAFPERPDGYYWTSSLYDGSKAWFVSIGMGNIYFLPTTYAYYARCVR